MQTLTDIYNLPLLASGEKTKARDILAALRTLARIEQDQHPATPEERQTLMRFSGFGPIALSLFPNPVSGRYKDASWCTLGEELRTLLSPEDYNSAKRTTFSAFYTAPAVIRAMYDALGQLGVPEQATVLEPGCGTGHFISHAPAAMRFIGIEFDRVSGRIARALHPGQDIRIENFRDTKLPAGRIDAVIGNVPFADVRLEYGGQRLPLHDFFLGKSLDVLKPGGILALVTSHYTLDKQNAGLREHMADRADFLGAVRLPSDAFKQEGTRVVTDILFLKRRAPGEVANHAHPGWLETAPLAIEGEDVAINRYFLERPMMVLGTWSRQDRLYGSETHYSVTGNGDLAAKLRTAIERSPQGVFSGTVDPRQYERRQLNRVYDAFVAAYGPVNKTTLSTTAEGTTIRRMPNLVKFRDDPDAMLVMSLEHYDEATGTAEKAAIMHEDVVGRSPPITHVRSAEEGLLVSLDQLGTVDLPIIADLYNAPLPRIIDELGDLIFQDPETQTWQTADVYLSGNVRAKLAADETAGPAYARNAEALRAVQPEDVLPGDIDANLGVCLEYVLGPVISLRQTQNQRLVSFQFWHYSHDLDG